MTAKFPLRSTLILGAIGVTAVVAPFFLIRANIIDAYIASILTIGGINAIMAMSVNMIVGVTGQLSLGQAGFLAIGAYACIFFHSGVGMPLPVAFVCAVLFTALAGFLIGFPVLKLSGDYLAIVTLGFGEIIRVVFNGLRIVFYGQEHNPLGGPVGTRFTTGMAMILNPGLAFVVTTGMLVLVLILLQNFLRSSYGRAIKACREDEIAANASGINIYRYKMLGFVMSAFIAGIGGALFVMARGFVEPNDAQFIRSIDFLIFVVLGGMGSMTGAILSAYVLTYLQEFLRFLNEFRFIIYPIILILVMLFRPKGLLGTRELSFIGLIDKISAKFVALRRKGGSA